MAARLLQEMLDVNLTGPWNTVRVALPTMIKQGDGGSIVFTGSVDALKGSANISSYAASKHGVTGLMRSLANEVGQYGIRVNSINPGHVDTDMLGNEFVWRLFRPDLEKPTKDDVVGSFQGTNLLPVPWMQPRTSATPSSTSSPTPAATRLVRRSCWTPDSWPSPDDFMLSNGEMTSQRLILTHRLTRWGRDDAGFTGSPTVSPRDCQDSSPRVRIRWDVVQNGRLDHVTRSRAIAAATAIDEACPAAPAIVRANGSGN